MRAFVAEGVARLRPYVRMARFEHWDKSAFVLVGAGVAASSRPDLAQGWSWILLSVAMLSASFVASSNYVLNELLDASTDRWHPTKKYRPAASGLVSSRAACIEWLGLATLGLGLALVIGRAFFAGAVALWLMGIAYNVPPIRTKDLPYVDVLTEAINHPIRLFMGWSVLIGQALPPRTFLILCWLGLAFVLAMKRYAEYRGIGDPIAAAGYRRSFAHYTDARLLASAVFYAILCSMLLAINSVRVHVERVLFLPLAAGFFAYYIRIGMLPDSPAQWPHRLLRQGGMGLYVLLCVATFVMLSLTSIPAVRELLGVDLPTGRAGRWHALPLAEPR